MSKHTTELVFDDNTHRWGQLYDPRHPAVHVRFTVDRMLKSVTFKHNGSASTWTHQTWAGAARRLLGSTAGIAYAGVPDSIHDPMHYISVRRGDK